MPPAHACNVNSVAGRSAHGPSRPNGVSAVTTARGANAGAANAARRSGVRPGVNRGSTPRCRRCGPAGSRDRRPPAPRDRQPRCASRPRGIGTGRRQPAVRLSFDHHLLRSLPSAHSTRMISAPPSASSLLKYAPGIPVERSNTTTPLSGFVSATPTVSRSAGSGKVSAPLPFRRASRSRSPCSRIRPAPLACAHRSPVPASREPSARRPSSPSPRCRRPNPTVDVRTARQRPSRTCSGSAKNCEGHSGPAGTAQATCAAVRTSTQASVVAVAKAVVSAASRSARWTSLASPSAKRESYAQLGEHGGLRSAARTPRRYARRCRANRPPFGRDDRGGAHRAARGRDPWSPPRTHRHRA